MLLLPLILFSQVIIDQHNFVGGGTPGNGLLNDLALYLKSDELSGQLLDATGNGRHLSELDGTVTTDTGILNTSRVYDGTAMAVNAYAAWNDFTGVSFTFGCWMYIDTMPPVNTGHMLISKGDASGGIQLQFVHDNSGNKRVNISINSVTSSYTPSPDMAEDTWYFVVGRYDLATQKVKVSFGAGGTLTHHTDSFATITLASNPGDFALAGTTEIWGIYPDRQMFAGRLDEIFVYRRRLSDADISLIYNGGTPLPFESYSF